MVYARARMGNSSLQSLFSDLWYHYYPRVHVFIRRMLTDPMDADDAAQEVMIKVYNRLRQYRPDYAVSTWIYSIARNHCLDTMRAVRRRVPVAAGGEPDSIAGPYRSPEEEILHQERKSLADELVSRLSPEDQQIALLHFFEEMPYRQVSAVMGIPTGTLKYRVHRIRKQLREEGGPDGA
jgi:RNA polymerase sigma factor (sigma-70 family)